MVKKKVNYGKNFAFGIFFLKNWSIKFSKNEGIPQISIKFLKGVYNIILRSIKFI